MSLRILTPLPVVLSLVGCAQTDLVYVKSPPPQVATAATDCSLHLSFYQYVMLRGDAMGALQKFKEFSARAILRDSEVREDADKAARAKADEVNNGLAGVTRRAESGKAAAGACFDVGDLGTEAAKQYTWTIETITEVKRAIAEELENILARNKAIDEERNNFDRWQANNRELLVRHVGGMKLEVLRIAKRDSRGRPASETLIAIQATNTTASSILKPTNQRVWGGSRLPIGASLTDSFGNDYRLESVTPAFLGIEAGGIRPGQTVNFELRFGDVPLENAKLVRLIVAPETFGQRAGITFELPSEAFYAPR